MKTTSRHQRGVSMVEFVIVFPVAVMFVLALLQVGLLYMAKQTLNHATFIAARAGSLNNANVDIMRGTMVRGLIPFKQNLTETNDVIRMGAARAAAWGDGALYLRVERMNPSPQSFSDFGLTDPATNQRYIPNDNLEWRNANIVGSQSRQNIRDANILKLRTVYGYEMKVPLIAGLVRRVMCSGTTGVGAWDVSLLDALSPASTDCLLYYMNGRIPIESFAIIEMQSRAIE